MRSLHLLDSWLPRTETFIWQSLRKLRDFPPLVLADRLENLGHFPLPNGEFLDLEPRRRLGAKIRARLLGGFAPVEYAGAEALRARRDIAVCHAHKGYRALVTRDLPRALNRPLLVNFYGSDVSQKEFLRRALPGYRAIFADARFLLVEGPAMRARLLSLGAPEGKIRIQRIAIDPRDYAFAERSWDGNRPVRFLHIGRMVPKKGLEEGLRALAASGAKYPWRLTVIGDGPLRRELEGLARGLGLADRVDFVGYRTLEEMRAALAAHDVLLQPSRTAPDGDGEGGAPTVLLEAQACGLPVLSTDHDDIPYVTAEGRSAWLAPQGDVAALAELLRRVGEASDRWGEMGRAGRAKIEADHDIDREIAALERSYAEAAG